MLVAVGPVRPGADGVALPNLVAYQAAFLAGAGLAIIGALIALGVPDRAAAATMRPRPGRGQASAPQEALAAQGD